MARHTVLHGRQRPMAARIRRGGRMAGWQPRARVAVLRQLRAREDPPVRENNPHSHQFLLQEDNSRERRAADEQGSGRAEKGASALHRRHRNRAGTREIRRTPHGILRDSRRSRKERPPPAADNQPVAQRNIRQIRRTHDGQARGRHEARAVQGGEPAEMKELVIFWRAKDPEARRRIRERFGIPPGMTVNGETRSVIRDVDIPLLEETARRGYIEIRNKPKRKQP